MVGGRELGGCARWSAGQRSKMRFRLRRHVLIGEFAIWFRGLKFGGVRKFPYVLSKQRAS